MNRYARLIKLLICVCLSVWLFQNSAPASDDAPVTLRFQQDSDDRLKLTGRDARLQLIVTADLANDDYRDWTHRSTYRTIPAGVAEVSKLGVVTPIADGTAQVIATDANGNTANVELVVEKTSEDLPVSFPGQVVPIFTKLSCNSGGCHGKLAGQNGFRLSLLGFGPREDYDHLVKESRGRRLSIAAPEQSLLLTKAINAAPHGGGQRLQQDSYEYRLLRRWIAQGMPYGDGDAPIVTAIDVAPQQRRLPTGATQQLRIVATYSDGTTEDITRAAVYESNDPEMAEVSTTGLVQLGDMVGDVAIMARYQGNVTAFRADLPLGATDSWQDSDWPEARNSIDKFVYRKLRSLGIPPSPPCDNATFIRRVTLDIAGRLPTIEEVRLFTTQSEDKAVADQRAALIDRLLNSEDYVDHFARKWNTILRNKRTSGSLDYRTVAFHRWIRDSLRANQPYDEFVRDIVTASGSVASNPPVAWLHQVPDTQQRIEDTAQLFLGQRIQCARCHHHPYEKWSQGDYAAMSAFFALMQKKVLADPGEPTFVSRVGTPSARHPRTGQGVKPAGLDGDELLIPPDEDPRQHLVDWMVNPENPFFASALANRYWKHFMGRGLVEPEDDMRATNPPSNPELLEAMSAAFIESGYDLKSMVRLICNSQTYATQSDALDDNINDRRSYSRFYPKRLQAETLLDALDQVANHPTRFAGMPANVRAVGLPDTQFDSYFLSVFGQPSSVSACECERTQDATLAQSLHLLNSTAMQTKLSTNSGRAATLAADTTRPDKDKIRDLYLLAFSRAPRDGELESTLEYLAKKEDRRAAFEDIVWTLVNSKEFLFNH